MRIGIDLGGTKIEGIALTDRGEIAARFRVPTPRDDYDGTVTALAHMVERLDQAAGTQSGIATVGLGIPGTVSPASGLVKNANSTWLIGRPLDRDLAQRLGRPVRIANDANCFALSEASDGAGAIAPDEPERSLATHGPRVVFGVIIGTGTGGGIVVGNQVLVGPNAIAGEWGHNPLPGIRADEMPGPDCYCGHRGCIETFLSGPAIRRDHEHATGERLEADAIAARATAGDGAAEATLARYEDRMARALASILNVLDPDVIVLGGGLSNIERLYRNVPKLWGLYAFSDTVTTRLVPPKHGDASGVRGAAWLWPLPPSASRHD